MRISGCLTSFYYEDRFEQRYASSLIFVEVLTVSDFDYEERPPFFHYIFNCFYLFSLLPAQFRINDNPSFLKILREKRQLSCFLRSRDPFSFHEGPLDDPPQSLHLILLTFYPMHFQAAPLANVRHDYLHLNTASAAYVFLALSISSKFYEVRN